MSRSIKITLNPKNNVYNIYTGETSETTTGLTCSNVTDECEFEFPDSYDIDNIWIRCNSSGCTEQIFNVFIGSEPKILCIDRYNDIDYDNNSIVCSGYYNNKPYYDLTVINGGYVWWNDDSWYYTTILGGGSLIGYLIPYDENSTKYPIGGGITPYYGIPYSNDWVLEDPLPLGYDLIANSTFEPCPDVVCFKISGTTYLKETRSKYNSKYYYDLGYGVTGRFVWWDDINSQWIQSSSLTGGTIYSTLIPSTTVSTYPIDDVNSWSVNDSSFGISKSNLSDCDFPPDPCCTPTITTITENSGNIEINFTLPTGNCLSCTGTTLQSSIDDLNWGDDLVSGCTSPITIPEPLVTTYYRIKQNCDGGSNSDWSTSEEYSPPTTSCDPLTITSLSYDGNVVYVYFTGNTSNTLVLTLQGTQITGGTWTSATTGNLTSPITGLTGSISGLWYFRIVKICITPSGSTATSDIVSYNIVQPNAVISVYGEKDLSGSNIIFSANVDSGTVLNNLTFSGDVQRYSGANCSTPLSSPCSFSGVTLTSGSTTISSSNLCSSTSVTTLKVTNLYVNATQITTSPQIITVGGNVYVIKRYNECGGV